MGQKRTELLYNITEIIELNFLGAISFVRQIFETNTRDKKNEGQRGQKHLLQINKFSIRLRAVTKSIDFRTSTKKKG